MLNGQKLYTKVFLQTIEVLKYVHIFDSFSAKLMKVQGYQKIFLHINCYPLTAGCLH